MAKCSQIFFWLGNFAILRFADIGVGYGNCLELAYLLFLKTANRYEKPPQNRKLNIPEILAKDTIENLKVGLASFEEVEVALKRAKKRFPSPKIFPEFS